MLIPWIRDSELRTGKGKVICRSSLLMVTRLFKTDTLVEGGEGGKTPGAYADVRYFKPLITIF